MFNRLSCCAAAILLAVGMALPAHAQLTAYSQDFEGLDIEDEFALAFDFLVFGNVFDMGGGQLYDYGPFIAPNGGEGFSAIVDDQGGPDQGAQQLSVYSDYANGDHACCLIEANFYREYPIDAADVGSTWTFVFDAKRGNIEGSSTALAFIKTLDPGAGFALTNFITQDTTDLPDTWTTHALVIDITADLEGQILQIGFANTATGFAGSGVFYDNLEFSTDGDGDGVLNNADNCILADNPGQQDSNGDGFGNLCDPDIAAPFCAVNFGDLNAMKIAFFSNPTSPTWNPDADLTSNGSVAFDDLNIMKSQFFGKPGPSALASCP